MRALLFSGCIMGCAIPSPLTFPPRNSPLAVNSASPSPVQLRTGPSCWIRLFLNVVDEDLQDALRAQWLIDGRHVLTTSVPPDGTYLRTFLLDLDARRFSELAGPGDHAVRARVSDGELDEHGDGVPRRQLADGGLEFPSTGFQEWIVNVVAGDC